MVSSLTMFLTFLTGPYTTTKTWGCQRKLLFWDSHMKRLAQSAQEMHRAGNWEEAPGDLTPAQVSSLTAAHRKAEKVEALEGGRYGMCH